MGRRQREREAKIARQRSSLPVRRSKLNVSPSVRPGHAPPHQPLVDDLVHVFVDDQNLFWGLVNDGAGISFRIDFGQLLTEVSKNSKGQVRGIKSAYIAGVIPNDDSFWTVVGNQGFTVRRGYLGSNNRSKQDDAFLITDMTATLYEEKGPSTIIIVAGDADYVPPMLKSLEKGWRNEVSFINRGAAAALDAVVHEFRVMHPSSIELLKARRK